MSLVNYKDKYLKYRTKYLELKNKKLIGGANCPKIGYFQHISECWHDALMIILLYSDGLSDHVQKIFDETDTYKFDIDECIEYAITNSPQYLKPINISPADNIIFMEYAKEYIKSLFARYNNEKLSIIPYDKIPPPIAPKPKFTLSPEIIEANRKIPDPPIKPSRYRRDSINESLSCNFSIFQITNINNTKRISYKHKIHGGNTLHTFTTISLYNYFLINYFPKKLETPNTEQIFTMFDSIILDQAFSIGKIKMINNIESFNKILENIVYSLQEMSFRINNCIGILLSVSHIFKIDKLISGEPIQANMGHAVAFIKCGGKEYFYDNNGVNPIEYKDFEIKPQDIELNMGDIYSHQDEELRKFKLEYRDNQKRLMVQFDWKKFFLKKIDETILKLSELFLSKDISRIYELKDLMLGFSDCFYGRNNPDKRMTIGNNMFKSFFANEFNFISDKLVEGEEQYDLFLNTLIFYNITYSNDEAIKKIIDNEFFKEILHTPGIEDIISVALKKNNTKLLDYIIQNSELGPDNIKKMIERLK
jgi:hypothetical protein